MEGKENISLYRDRLDKTVASYDLSNEESLKILVENQMLKSSQHENRDYNDNLVQKRTKEVANFLSMLRSASGGADEESKTKETPNGGWKIKHDNQDCRVMYREGPAGTPFHNLLVEGYVDGPVDTCMCISWEAGLYPKWWPQFSIPAFKVVSSECLQKVRMGEQISIVRMKLSWPLSAREALVHYVTFEYFQDDLIIVLLNTISDTENIDESTHGFTKDGIPDVEKMTRIDVVGGLALQKVTANRSYFRTIVNMDLKLDFVPPAIINFVSRQLVGSGFKLYKKEVASVSKGDADFSEALKDPFYSRIREALYSGHKIPNRGLEQENVKIFNGVLDQENVKIINGVLDQENVKIGQHEEVKDQESVSEIEEIQETTKSREDDKNNSNNSCSSSSSNESYERHHTNNILNEYGDITGKKQVKISPEVNQALGTLEKVISIFKEFGFNPRSLSFSRFSSNVFANLENEKTNNSRHFEAPKNELTTAPQESRISFHCHSSRHVITQDQEVAQGEDTSSSHGTRRSSFSFVVNEAATSAVAEKHTNGEMMDTNERSFPKKKNKKHRFCCLNG